MAKKNQYDVTVDATIIDVSQKPDGIYRVKTTGAEFEAFATAGSYYKNDIVLVQIPNGDYKNPKFILGRKADIENNQTFSFKLPFDDFIGLRYINKDDNFHGAYWANYPTIATDPTTQNQLRYNQLNTKVWSWINNEGSTIGCTRLGIEAEWQTFLGSYQPLRGVYGFRIIVKGVTASTEVTAATEIEREYYFTNNDMYGNPYAYQTPYAQQKVIDISDFLNVHSLDIYFYQDFNFADAANVPIYYYDEEMGPDGRPMIPENILFNNVNIYLGVSAEDIKDETTFLYSYNALTFTSEEKEVYDEELQIRQTVFTCNEEHDLYFTWVHYESDGTYTVIKDVNDLAAQRNKAGKKTHVYWYRYNYDDHITDKEKIWKVEHSELEKDWNDSLNNPNYETQIERYGGEHWTFLPYATDDFALTFIPRGDKSREKFKVVVQHDGTHTTSEEIVFKNNRDIEAELLDGAKNDAVIIKCFKLEKIKNETNTWTGEYAAVEDGSINAFHVYDENNTILHNDDNERFDEHYYYLQIHFRNDDTNLYEILKTIAENGTDTGSSVAWAFPRSYSMIRSTEEVNEYDAEYFGIDAETEPIRYQNFHNATMKFTIQSIYNNRYLDNTVSAIVNQNGKNHYIEKDLMFGRAEGLGHEFLPIIEIVEPVGGTYICAGQPFKIACAVYNRDGSLFEIPSLLTFTWRELSGQCEFFHGAEDGSQVDGYVLGSYNGDNAGYITKYAGYRNNVVSGTLKTVVDGNTPPPIFEVTVNGAASYPLTVRKGFMICNDFNYKKPRDISVPSRVEFKSDGADPIFYSDYFEVAELISEENAAIAEYKIEYPEWKINNESILHLESTTTPRELIEYDENNEIITSDRGYTRYKLAFNTEGHPQWVDEYLKPDNYTYIYYKYNTEDLNIYLAQALAFDRNYYASSLVNDWDGTSLTWDEENGAILSTMIAAGSKDGNNKFTGVMMGDWHARGDESLDTPGLYGYNKGAQTFGFKTDGTGFIGASGKGRIEFDGTEALISNADRSCYINLNPVSLSKSLTDLNNQSFSENFVYCKVEKTDNLFDSISDSIASKTSWAKKYYDDKEHDYFVVDPNYGVLTTGGVIARYGALGNWMISHEGLYQKTDNTYMYLGFDETDITAASAWQKLQVDLTAIQNDCEDLYAALAVNEANFANAEETQAIKESEKPDKVAEYESQIATAEAEIARLTAVNTTLNNEIADINTTITEKEQAIQDQYTEKKNLTLAISDNYDTIRNKEAERAVQEQIIRDSGDEYAAELVLIEQKIVQINNIINDLNYNKQLIDTYSNDLQTLNTDRSTYIGQQAQYTTEVNKYESEIDTIEQDIETIQNQITACEENITDTQVKINTDEDIVYALLVDLDYTDFTIKTSQAYQKDKQDVESKIQSLSNEIIILQEQIADNNISDEPLSDEEIQEIQNQINEKTTEKENFESQLEKYDSLISTVQDIESLKIELNTYTSNLETYNDELAIQQTLFSTAQDNLNKASISLDTVNNALSVINNSYDLLLNYTNNLEKNFDKIYSDILTLKQEVMGADKTISNYPNTESEFTEIYYIIRDNLKELTDKYDCLYAEVNTNSSSTNISTTLQAQKQEISDKVTTNNTITQAQEAIDRINTEITTLQNDIAEKETAILQCDQTIKVLEAEISELKQERNNKEIEITTNTYGGIGINYQTNKITALNKSIDDLQAEIDALQLYKDELEEEINEIKTEIKNKKETINRIQADAAEKTDYEITSLHVNSTLEDIKNVILNLKTAINDIIFANSIRYAIYVSTSEPNVSETQVTPYFSVTWDGTMFARKGLIANTWSIDDHALTYQKNNDILYLGTEESGFDGYIPLGRAVSLTDNRRWAISASDKYNEDKPNDPYLINFGVSLSGELYAQLGTIGGWQISQNTITSPTSSGTNIILDAANNQIKTSNGAFVLDGNTGTLRLNANYNDSNQSNVGLVYLAEYLLMGRTVTETLSYSNSKLRGEDTAENRAISGGLSDNYGWATVGVGGRTVATYSNGLISNLNYSLDSNQTNYLQFLDAGHNYNGGAILASGLKTGSSNTSDVATIFYPVKDGSVLGLQGHRWNLMAENIDANLINAGAVNGEKMYEKMERLATQIWVTDALAELWNAIAEVSNKAGQAMASGKAQTVTKVDITGGTTWNPFGIVLGIGITKGNGSYLTDTVEGGINLAHGHSLDGSFSEGKFTCTIGGVTFNQTNSYSYDVTTSDWYKRKIAEAYNRGASDTRNSISVSVSSATLDGRSWINGTSSGSGSYGFSASGTAKATASYRVYTMSNSGAVSSSGGTKTTSKSYYDSDSHSWKCGRTHGSSSSSSKK